MAYLIDTSILVRLANTVDARHPVVAGAVLELHRRGEVLHLTPQVLVEFRNVATRPITVNGLGLSAANAETHAAAFEAKFPLLVETPDIFPAWKALVTALGRRRCCAGRGCIAWLCAALGPYCGCWRAMGGCGICRDQARPGRRCAISRRRRHKPFANAG